ncbi:hypothetical protein Tco_0747492 [Tanacetum coccineum]|uniref:Uncharacterized protein n=1 Tax=Tanacetum coccineum TaxID=301880 RepID=A0ABQ4YU34_9ASTR
MLTLQDLKKSRKLSLQSFRTSESMSSSNVKVMKSRRRKITKAFKIATNMSMSNHSSANGKTKKRSHILQANQRSRSNVKDWITGEASEYQVMNRKDSELICYEFKYPIGIDESRIVILSFFVLPEDCDPLALVDGLNPVEDNTGLLETRFDEETVFVFPEDEETMFVFPEDVTSLVNLTLCLGYSH